MKTFNRALLGATALTAIAGMAFAQSNSADTAQSGNNNALLVHQSQTGATPGDNIAGTTAQPITQNGNDNDIDILQVHNGADPDANVVGTMGNGVDQTGHNNKLTISQTGGDQRVHDVQQSGGAAVTSNDTSITQTGYQNAVSNIDQDFNGNSGSRGNTIVIDQSDMYNIVGNTPGNVSPGTGIIQTGNGNAADVEQIGRHNHLYTLDQSGNGNGAASNIFNLKQTNTVGGQGNRVQEAIQINNGAAANTADITQDGQSNGYGAFVGTAGNVGVSGMRMRQNGSGNDLDYVATGDWNRFGFIQDGHRNVIDGRSIGSTNEMGILQDGNDNIAIAEQLGVDNQMGALMDGHRNKLDMFQDNGGFGAGNAIEVTIDGNDNNNHPTSPAFSGDAFAARNVARNEGGVFTLFSQGDLFQKGNGNDISLDVTGNANAFAMAQNGDDNTITGTITHGSMNQAVVAQVSSNNSATFTIGGVGNNTGIIQN